MLLHYGFGSRLDLLSLYRVTIVAHEHDERMFVGCRLGNLLEPLIEPADLDNTRHVVHNNKGLFVAERARLLTL